MTACLSLPKKVLQSSQTEDLTPAKIKTKSVMKEVSKCKVLSGSRRMGTHPRGLQADRVAAML